MRSIDPTSCWIRHVVRGEGGTSIAGASFVKEGDKDSLQGASGWTKATASPRLSEDGTGTLLLPNSTGPDGVLHRRRFRCLTAPDYEPGEEWIELWTDADSSKPLLVATPTDAEKSTSSVALKLGDLMAVLQGSLSSEADQWTAVAPRDALAHYSRLAVLAAEGEPKQHVAEGNNLVEQTVSGIDKDCWALEATFRYMGPTPPKEPVYSPQIGVGLFSEKPKIITPSSTRAGGLLLILSEGRVWLTDNDWTGLGAHDGKALDLTLPGEVNLRLVRRYDHLFGYINGQLIAELRTLSPGAIPTPSFLELIVANGNQTAAESEIVDWRIESLRDFGRCSTAQRLPGLPPPGGLNGQYWGVEAGEPKRLAKRFWPLGGEQESTDRIEATTDWRASTAPTIPVVGAFLARWSGSIHLDLAANDIQVRVNHLRHTYTRVYLGKLMVGNEMLDGWVQPEGEGEPEAEPAIEGTGIKARTWLGTEESGWYPLKIEQYTPNHVAGETGGLILEWKIGAGAWEKVPLSAVSPLGCYENVVRLTPHREVFADIAGSFGYQWRVEARSLESGEAPGKIVAAELVGRETAKIIDDDSVGTSVQVQVACSDVVDGLVVDAAGLADPNGGGQLTAQVIDTVRAKDHMALRQAYESLADIKEDTLLRTRADSLLALRSSPNEQVGVRPDGERDFVDSFPLAGELARFDWEPGDAPMLRLDSVDVRDESPRQLTGVDWTLVQDGLSPPTVSFRQRPRDARSAMRRLNRSIVAPRRAFQGSVAILTGTMAGVEGGAGPSRTSFDSMPTDARVNLPTGLRKIVRAVAVVNYVTGGPWTLEVSPGITREGIIQAAGRYDVTRLIEPAAPGAPFAWARLVGGTSGIHHLTLEIWVAI